MSRQLYIWEDSLWVNLWASTLARPTQQQHTSTRMANRKSFLANAAEQLPHQSSILEQKALSSVMKQKSTRQQASRRWYPSSSAVWETHSFFFLSMAVTTRR